MSKYFFFSNENVNSDIAEIENPVAEIEVFESNLSAFKTDIEKEKEKILSKIRPRPGNLIVSINKEGKNTYQLTPDIQIQLARNVENLNRRETMPVNAVVVYSEKHPPGTEVLVHHNSFDPNNELFDIFPLSGDYEANDIKYFSIKEEQCFLYREGEDWLPCAGFETALRLYKPYTGTFIGVEHTLIKGQLLITSGELKGKACHVVVSSDYEIVYQGTDGKEQRKIRLRHFPNEENEREEVTAINHKNTELYNKGELLAGLTPQDAKPIEKFKLDSNSCTKTIMQRAKETHIHGGKITSIQKIKSNA
jgi:hypothetical protein